MTFWMPGVMSSSNETTRLLWILIIIDSLKRSRLVITSSGLTKIYTFVLKYLWARKILFFLLRLSFISFLTAVYIWFGQLKLEDNDTSKCLCCERYSKAQISNTNQEYIYIEYSFCFYGLNCSDRFFAIP